MTTIYPPPPSQDPRHARRVAVEEAVDALVKRNQNIRFVGIQSTFVPVHDLTKDIVHANNQFDLMEENGWSAVAALFSQKPVPICIPNLDIAEQSYNATVSELQKSGIPLTALPVEEARLAFRERAVEFLDARTEFEATKDPITITVVDSVRTGDVVLYTNGYFLSTQTAFGVSTPARQHLPAGRYAFGIKHNGIALYDGNLWTVPQSSKIWLNLP